MEICVMILACIGLALDDFILMMGKGATLKDLTVEKTMSYAGIFGMMNMAMALLGYLFSDLFENVLVFRINMTLAALIYLLIGLLFLHKVRVGKGVVERLDLSFNKKMCAKLALVASITTFFFGVGNGLMNYSMLMLVICSFVVCTLMVAIALRIGYSFGYRYGRVLQVLGGVLLILIALNIWVAFLR